MPWSGRRRAAGGFVSEAPILFDRRLLRARRARFAHEVEARSALLDRVATEIAERVGIMLRPFPRALDLGAYRGLLGLKVAALPSVGAMIYAESVGGASRALPAPSACLRRGPAALQGRKPQSCRFGAHAPPRERPSRRIDPGAARAGTRWAVHGGGAGRALALELRQALLEAEAETSGGASPRVAPFADVRDYGGLLQRAGFALPVADADTLKLTYPSPRDLMREIRALGGGNVLVARSKAPLARGTLRRAEDIYRARYGAPGGSVRATFEIVYLSGWAPDPSQQQPLKPGSAAKRLADALGTAERSAGDKTPFPAAGPKRK